MLDFFHIFQEKRGGTKIYAKTNSLLATGQKALG